MKTFVLAIVLTASLGFTGCGGSLSHVAIQHPGAINAFDDQAYSVLKDAQAAIFEAKASLAKFPAAAPTLNKLIRAYNAANEVWQLYHANGAGAPTQATLAPLISAVAVAATDVLKAFGVMIKPGGAAMNYRPVSGPQEVEKLEYFFEVVTGKGDLARA